MDNFKETSLKGHIQLCELRYKALEDKIHDVEAKINNLETRVSDLNKTIQSNFLEIKLAIEASNNKRDIQVIATMGTIAVAVISVIGYWLTH